MPIFYNLFQSTPGNLAKQAVEMKDYWIVAAVHVSVSLSYSNTVPVFWASSVYAAKAISPFKCDIFQIQVS